MLKDKIDNVYEIIRPAQASWVVFDSPHSGRTYPEDFNHIIPQDKMVAAEDSMVDDLFADAPRKGAIMLKALFPRTYIDPNREVSDIKRLMLADPQNWPHGFRPTDKSRHGHGLIRETLYNPGEYLYDRTLSAAELVRRIETYHAPYHEALKSLLDESYAQFGHVWHLNCHSMPSSCASFGGRIDFCLGDAFGRACEPSAFTDIVAKALRDMGYSVRINNPFAGVRLVTDYSAPVQGRHSLQIEINKAIYWDEAKDSPNEDYAQVKADIARMTDRLIAETGNLLAPKIAAS